MVPRAIENIKQMPASNQINMHTQTNTNIICYHSYMDFNFFLNDTNLFTKQKQTDR